MSLAWRSELNFRETLITWRKERRFAMEGRLSDRDEESDGQIWNCFVMLSIGRHSKRC